MGTLHDKRYPGENEAYRAARDRLLTEEIELRRHVERVAALRRELPPGGKLKQDYVFEEGATKLSDKKTVRKVKLSRLFERGKDTLVVYGYMYAPKAAKPCPMCTSFLDSLNGSAPHIGQRVNLVVVAKAPIQKLRDWARPRGWNNLRLLSSNKNSFNTDYLTERGEAQMPVLNVFQKTKDGIRHTYGTEMLFMPSDPGQNGRHIDMAWPLWNIFDFTPGGRGTDWFPKTSYD